MEREPAYYSLIAFGVAVLLGLVAVVFSILFEKRMRMHARQNIMNVLMHPCKIELKELRKEIEQLKETKLDRVSHSSESNNEN